MRLCASCPCQRLHILNARARQRERAFEEGDEKEEDTGGGGRRKKKRRR